MGLFLPKSRSSPNHGRLSSGVFSRGVPRPGCGMGTMMGELDREHEPSPLADYADSRSELRRSPDFLLLHAVR